MDNLTIRFYFESGIKKYREFRESLWYKAIFETFHEKDISFGKEIMALDIATYIKKNYPKLFKEQGESDERLGKKIGACLSQLKKWEMVTSTELEHNKSLRQKLYKLNDRYKDFLVKNISSVFLE